MRLFGNNNNKFYLWFEEAAKNNFLAAKELRALLKNYTQPKKTAEKIHKLEHDSDDICHKIYEEINSSFITPIDREDVINLTKSLDDVLDLIHASSDSFDTFGLKKPSPALIKFSEIIYDSTKIINDILPKLRKRKTFPVIRKAIIDINKLENEADELFKAALKDLFGKKKNPVDIIRFKNIYENMEEVIDRCEDVGDVLRNLTTKYA